MPALRAIAVCLSLASAVRAAPAWTEAAPGDALRLDVPVDAAVVAGSSGLWLASQLLQARLAPSACRWCDGADDAGLPGSAQAGRGRLNAVDAFVHDALTGAVVSRGTADALSGALAFGVAPAFAITAALVAKGEGQSNGEGFRAAVLVGESAAVAGLATQIIKLAVARKRPFVRYGDGATSGTYDVGSADSRQGFPSGHTALVAALGTSSALCASLSDAPSAPWLWGGAGALVLLTGALRIVAEKHYLTDVAAGAVIGAGAGFAVPLLHRAPVSVSGNGFEIRF